MLFKKKLRWKKTARNYGKERRKKKKSKESLVGNGWGGGELKEEIGRVDSAYVA